MYYSLFFILLVISKSILNYTLQSLSGFITGIIMDQHLLMQNTSFSDFFSFLRNTCGISSLLQKSKFKGILMLVKHFIIKKVLRLILFPSSCIVQHQLAWQIFKAEKAELANGIALPLLLQNRIDKFFRAKEVD